MKYQFNKYSYVTSALPLLLLQASCTGQIPSSFRYLQQEETFSSKEDVNTKIDLLWVVDNSSSMDTQQEKLRKGFAGFASEYLQPTWDIQVAVITTDTYLAHPSFQDYLTRTLPNTISQHSPYIQSVYSLFNSLPLYQALFSSGGVSTSSGLNLGHYHPTWGSSYSQLINGIHDGPIVALCFEDMPYFDRGASNCRVRDQQVSRDTSLCLNATTSAASQSQCINTVLNDTIHSGKAIIKTMPDVLNVDTAAWTQQLVNDFMVNASTGSTGSGSERGISSVLQLIRDNEKESSNTRFFRKGSLRGIIFVSDEDDQSMSIPESPPAGYTPTTNYGCNLAHLNSVNTSGMISSSKYCCADPSSGCLYGDTATTCSSKPLDGGSYTLDVCVDSTKLIPIADVKQSLDAFFINLDGSGSTDANYFVASIVPTTIASVQGLHTQRNTGTPTGLVKTVEADRADRYIDLGTLVGGEGSIAMDISEDDYSPILDKIGQSIVEKKSTFTLARAATNQEEMLVKVLHANGTETVVLNDEYEIREKSIVFVNQNFVLGLKADDKIVINYQPKTAK